jgi:hypothetical protein
MEPTKLAKQFLNELRTNPLFQETVKELKKFRPVVPAYKPCQSQEETSSLWERIKFESGKQEGFDLIYLLLTGDRNE